MHLQKSTDVFIVGGGPAGLAAALAARRRGFRVTVADCSIPPVDKPCGEGIMPDGLAAAQALGLDLESAGGRRFRGIRFASVDCAVEANFPKGYGIGMRRTVLHELLIERAGEAGVRILWGARTTGIGERHVTVDGARIPARWIVGADGGRSAVRRWAGLEQYDRDSRRYGFRRHYRVAPWSEFMELHWGDGCQLYLTPVSEDEVCAVVISRDAQLRLETALPRFPQVEQRLAGRGSNLERGAVSASRRLHAVYRGNVALVGDASGSVDAITGEGIRLSMEQSVALAASLEREDLSLYQAAHRRIGKRPQFMADLMLQMDARTRLRQRTLRALARRPSLFADMLALHVGELRPLTALSSGLALGWGILSV